MAELSFHDAVLDMWRSHCKKSYQSTDGYNSIIELAWEQASDCSHYLILRLIVSGDSTSSTRFTVAPIHNDYCADKSEPYIEDSDWQSFFRRQIAFDSTKWVEVTE